MDTDSEHAPIDKSGWGDGPWKDEPDRKEWRDPATGLVCLALRNDHFGNWCGYVAVPPGHPAHGKDYDDLDVSVHGGLTYAKACSGDICHVPAPGEPDDVWWLGFDCGHYMDLMPGYEALRARIGMPDFTAALHDIFHESYKPLTYVESECTDLAKQLAAMV